MDQKQHIEKDVLLRSSALVVAVAVHDVYPGFLPIEASVQKDCFYYDFLVKTPYEGDLLPLVQEKIDRLTKLELPVETRSMMRENAITFLRHRHLPLQSQYLEMRGENVVELGQLTEFIDFTSGPLVTSTKEIGAIQLTHFSYLDAYYPHIGQVSAVRMFGVAFSDKKEMKRYLKKEHLAKANNPVALCSDLQLVEFLEGAPGRPSWMPKGMVLRERLLSLWKQECVDGEIGFVTSPRVQIAAVAKRRTLSPFQELFPAFEAMPPLQFEEDGRLYAYSSVSDAHAELFKKSNHVVLSPVRYAELLEKELPFFLKDCDGLFRSKSSFGDVGHTFCSLEMLEDEFVSSLQRIKRVYQALDIKISLLLRLPKEKRKGREEEALAQLIQSALKRCDLTAEIQLERVLLSGPRIEVVALDLRERSHTVAVVGVDNELPVKHTLSFKEGQGIGPVCVIATSLFVSLERVVALLVEKHEGKLPLWMTPELVRLVLMQKNRELHAFASQVKKELHHLGVGVGFDDSVRPLPAKLYDCHKACVPFVAVIGEKELKKQEVSLRHLREKDTLTTHTFEEFFNIMKRALLQNLQILDRI